MSDESDESDDPQTQAINAVAWEVEQLRQEVTMTNAFLGDIFELLKKSLPTISADNLPGGDKK